MHVHDLGMEATTSGQLVASEINGAHLQLLPVDNGATKDRNCNGYGHRLNFGLFYTKF